MIQGTDGLVQAKSWQVLATVRRYDADINEFIREFGPAIGARMFDTFERPYDEERHHGNLLVNAGIQLLEDLLIGAGGTVYSNANAHIGVGEEKAPHPADGSGADRQRGSHSLLLRALRHRSRLSSPRRRPLWLRAPPSNRPAWVRRTSM